jgi:hypothetical protein
MGRTRFAVMLGAMLVICAVAEIPMTALQFRKVVNHSLMWDTPTVSVPSEAVRVYVHEGEAEGVWIHPETIAVQYLRSGVLFDRKTGQVLRRYTVADGWPAQKPKEFPPLPSGPQRNDHLVGPGVLESYRGITLPTRPGNKPVPVESHAVAASVEFNGRLWQAMQPIGFFNSLLKRAGDDWANQNKKFGSWTSILQLANSESFLESRSKNGSGKAVRYTTKEGLASNLITHLAVAEGKLWAACVDIYDPDKKAWGPGGLCCYDPKTSAWMRVKTVAGKPVRWVTLLQTIGDDLWIGFREGDGVAGDSVRYGMGLYPDQYRPMTTSITLALFSKGNWTAFSRPPLKSVPSRRPVSGNAEAAPGETPRTLAILKNKLVVLFSQYQFSGTGDWNTDLAGLVSLLDMKAGKWQAYDVQKDFAAYKLQKMVAEDGEVIVLTDKGVRRWYEDKQKWIGLDPNSPLKNPSISAVTCVGNELWVGYTNQAFGVLGRQGISRFNEEKKKWIYTSPEEIGTACPVRSFVPLENGYILVLFRERHLITAAVESPFYPEPRGSSGLGRFKDGKWEFPITLDGLPANETRTREGPNGPEEWQEPLLIRDMAAVGGKVYVLNGDGVYEGPGKWRLVVKTNADVFWSGQLAASEDGKVLEIQKGFGDERTIYDPVTGKTTEVKSQNQGLRQDWTEITNMGSQWALGSLGSDNHRVVETPWAVWLISQGELIRLDRAMLAKILKP